MLNYSKTELGIEALQQRSGDLNARQRRLLLVIGTDAFDLLNDSHKERLAPPELLDQLQEMGLIVASTTDDAQAQTPVATSTSVSEIQVSANTLEQAAPAATSTQTSQPIETTLVRSNNAEQPQVALEALNFEQTKQLMGQLLSQYCGLMAKQLLVKIQNAPDSRSLKQCQMQWITSLQESRISPQQLNHALQQINYSLQQLHHS